VTPTSAQQLASQARKAREAVLRRDQLIRQMRDEGSTFRSIAEICGLTHTAVAKIVAKA
jgi:predicted transcriptional regulator